MSDTKVVKHIPKEHKDPKPVEDPEPESVTERVMEQFVMRWSEYGPYHNIKRLKPTKEGLKAKLKSLKDKLKG